MENLRKGISFSIDLIKEPWEMFRNNENQDFMSYMFHLWRVLQDISISNLDQNTCLIK